MENTTFEDILIRSRVTILDMLEARGYDTKPYRKLSAGDLLTLRKDKDDINKDSKTPEALRMDLVHKSDPERKAIVHYLLDNIKTRVGSGDITNKLLMSLDDEAASKNPLAGVNPKTTEVIIIYKMTDRIVVEKGGADKVTGENTDSYDKAALDAWMRPAPTPENPNALLNFRLQFWPIQRIVNNPMLHDLQPKFEVVPQEKEKDILKEFCARSKLQFPFIKFHADPVARFLGLIPGQLVKITRASQTAGEYVLYRVCVP